MTQEAIIFGRVLRKLRRDRDLSQEALAFESRIDRSHISDMERGKYQPTITTIFKLARALGISTAEMMTAVEEQIEEKGT